MITFRPHDDPPTTFADVPLGWACRSPDSRSVYVRTDGNPNAVRLPDGDPGHVDPRKRVTILGPCPGVGDPEAWVEREQVPTHRLPPRTVVEQDGDLFFLLNDGIEMHLGDGDLCVDEQCSYRILGRFVDEQEDEG